MEEETFNEKYNYKDAIKEDIRDYIKCNYADPGCLDPERMYDDLFCNDSVTGNASGSYTCNPAKARRYVMGNEQLVKDALLEFCTPPEEAAEHIFDYEWMDVNVRCHLLRECIDEVIEEIGENGWPD